MGFQIFWNTSDTSVRRVEHWDVNNELLHGQLYEELTGDPHFTGEIFRSVSAFDPDVKLFLNDYNVVANGGSTNVSHSQSPLLDFCT